VTPDALGVTSGRESRIRYNRVDMIARLAYYDRQVERRLACANQRHRSRAIRVHRICAPVLGLQTKGMLPVICHESAMNTSLAEDAPNCELFTQTLNAASGPQPLFAREAHA